MHSEQTKLGTRLNAGFVAMVLGTWGLVAIGQEPTVATMDPTSATAAVPRSVPATITIEGQLRTVDEWTAAAPQAGFVEVFSLTEGHVVQQEEILFTLDRRLLKNDLAAAEAALEAARLESDLDSELRNAELTAEIRHAELRRGVAANRSYELAVSPAELQRLRLLAEQADLGIRQTTHRQAILRQTYAEKLALTEIARQRLRRAEIKAKLSGIVVEVYVRSHQWVSEGEPLARVINVERLRFEALVDYRQAAGLRTGTKVTFSPIAKEAIETIPPEESNASTNLADGTSPGRITFVSPEINPVTKQVRVHAEIENRQQPLLPGMSGRLTLGTPTGAVHDQSR